MKYCTVCIDSYRCDICKADVFFFVSCSMEGVVNKLPKNYSA